MWWLYFIGGLVCGWLLLSKDFWGFIFGLIVGFFVGKKVEMPEILPDKKEQMEEDYSSKPKIDVSKEWLEKALKDNPELKVVYKSKTQATNWEYDGKIYYIDSNGIERTLGETGK